jgi:hypothetical protein
VIIYFTQLSDSTWRTMPQARAKPGKLLLSPSDHTLIMIDHQSHNRFLMYILADVLAKLVHDLPPQCGSEPG